MWRTMDDWEWQRRARRELTKFSGQVGYTTVRKEDAVQVCRDLDLALKMIRLMKVGLDRYATGERDFHYSDDGIFRRPARRALKDCFELTERENYMADDTTNFEQLTNRVKELEQENSDRRQDYENLFDTAMKQSEKIDKLQEALQVTLNTLQQTLREHFKTADTQS